MSLLRAYLLPHPPEAVAAEETKDAHALSAIRKSYSKVAEEIAELKPETIIVLSSHASAFSDYFQISDGEVGLGSMKDYGAPNITFRVFYDKEFVKRLSFCSLSNNLPAGVEGNQLGFLDHGTMVPLFFINRLYRDYQLVRIGLSGLSLLDHYRLGIYINKTIGETGRKAVIIATGDLSHIESNESSYGYNPQGKRYDEQFLSDLKAGNFGNLLDYSRDELTLVKQCAHKATTVLCGAFDCQDVEPELLAYESYHGVGYAAMSFKPLGKNQSRSFYELYLRKQRLNLNEEKKHNDKFVALAYTAIETYVTSQKIIAVPEDFVFWGPSRGVFVTIEENGSIRGCIGTSAPLKNTLGEEIVANAISSASFDPRFPPLRKDELPYIKVTLDFLSIPELVENLDDLDPEKYGIIIQKGSRHGLLLPNLADIHHIDEQIDVARKKAGIDFDEDYDIYRFVVERHQ